SMMGIEFPKPAHDSDCLTGGSDLKLLSLPHELNFPGRRGQAGPTKLISRSQRPRIGKIAARNRRNGLLPISRIQDRSRRVGRCKTEQTGANPYCDPSSNAHRSTIRCWVWSCNRSGLELDLLRPPKKERTPFSVRSSRKTNRCAKAS